MSIDANVRIESELEVKAYLQNLKYALDHGAQISFQRSRKVDDNRDIQFTNQYTVRTLFPNRSEMREFGKVYNGTEDVYIKVRVDLLGDYGNSTTFVMSFHFAETPFKPEMFPYRKK